MLPNFNKIFFLFFLIVFNNLYYGQNSWQKLLDTNITGYIKEIVSDLNGNLYVAATKGLFFISGEDNSWKNLYPVEHYWESPRAILLLDESNILIGTEVGIFESGDAGLNWSRNSLDSSFIEFITMNRNGIIYTGWNPIYKSTDNGSNWTIINNNLYTWQFYETVSGKYLAGTTCGIFLSENSSNTWNLTGYFDCGDITVITGINNDETILIGGADRFHGIYYSSNEGYDWIKIANSDTIESATTILQINNDEIYFSSLFNGLFKYSSSDSSFRHINVGPYNTVSSLALDSLGYMYVAAVGIYKTDFPVDSSRFIRNIEYNFSIEQNYPNPFNNNTFIEYTLKQPTNVNLSIYNFLGEKVTELVNQFQNKGKYKINFNSNSLSSGIYFYRMRTSDFCETKKMILLK